MSCHQLWAQMTCLTSIVYMVLESITRTILGSRKQRNDNFSTNLSAGPKLTSKSQAEVKYPHYVTYPR